MPFHYLDETPERHDHPERAFASAIIDRPGLIIYVGHHLSATDPIPCTIHRMSLYGAELVVKVQHEMPVNFFLEIKGIRDEIGCTLLRREGTHVLIAFNMLIDADFFRHVLTLGNEVHR